MANLKISLVCIFLNCFIVASGIKLTKRDLSLVVNDFAFDLYRVVTSADNSGKNLFFSPYSIYTALTMIALGARGNTEKELNDIMSWQYFITGDEQNNGHQSFKDFTSLFMGEKHSTGSFYLANKLWLQKYFKTIYLKRYYRTRLFQFYSTDLGMVNFALDPIAARHRINEWVKEETNNKIKELIRPGLLTSLTRLVLTNAIYFKSKWKIQFNKYRTSTMKFHVHANRQVQVPMMFVKSKFRYTENDECKIVELPYQNNQMSMFVFVPRIKKTLFDLEKFISAEVIHFLNDSMKAFEVSVRIPKFKLESSLNLKKDLKQLGIRDLFDPVTADLSGILGFRSLYVSHVTHKSFVEVNEFGTEAAAATAVLATKYSSLNNPRKFIVANKPFFFVIRHNISGALIFIGRLIDPTSS